MPIIVTIIISVLFSAFFSGMEIAYISSNKLKIELHRKEGSFNSKIISFLSRYPGQYIVTMLIGNNIALVIYGILMAILLKPLIHTVTEHDVNILILQTIISTLIILFTAEFLPKILFRINPNSFLKIFAIPVLLFFVIFYPVSRLTIYISNFILGTFFKVKIHEKQENIVFGKVDIDNLMSEKRAEQKIKKNNDVDFRIFQNALDFSDVKLRECIVPRTEIIAVKNDSEIEDLQQKFIETGLSKILVFKESIDRIIGYIHMKDMFNNPDNIESNIIDVSIVPETMPANKLLEMFVKEKKNIAVVVDEFGGTSGIVTIEDILEEIFGEIEDEHDTSKLTEQKINEHEYLFSGRLEVDYLNEKYNFNLPKHDEYETLAGLILHFYESIPKPKELIIIKLFEFRVLKVSETRIELLNLKILPNKKER
ncbi:MAG: HlyC/CorC family transporter [Bacteroidales bacterium]|nr:HlyC/CorC family transporter [Bacteroidales bacterium]